MIKGGVEAGPTQYLHLKEKDTKKQIYQSEILLSMPPSQDSGRWQ
jgi:hypothetical protein